MPVAGRPLLLWSFETFLYHPAIMGVSVVVPPEYTERAPPWLERLREDGTACIVSGGPRRTDSVRRGLASVADGAEFVAVHDAARPLLSDVDLGRLLSAVATHEAVIAARPVADTLKEVADQRVVRTVDRRSLWQAETPQVFSAALIRRVHERAQEEGVSASDCAALCERYGVEVHVVELAHPNVKVTTRGDLDTVELALRHRKAGRSGRG